MTIARLAGIGLVLLVTAALADRAAARDPSPAGHSDSATPQVTVLNTLPERLTRSSPAEPAIVSIPLDKSHIVTLPEAVRDVIVPNPDIVDIVIKRPTEAYLVAKKIGETNIFFIGRDGNVILHLEARVQLGLDRAKAAIEALFPNGGIKLSSVNNSIILSGTVRSPQESANAANVIRPFVNADSQVINMLSIVGDQQVLLKVRVAEIQRSAVKTLGGSLSVDSGDSLGLFTFGANAGPAADSFGTLFAQVNKLAITDVTFSALEARGLAKTLAEPALLSISGETANFLAGGEFPVPTGRDENNNITIEFKKFGVSLSFTPVVLSERQISLRIKTEVSRLDASEQIQLFGTTVKGLSVRRADNTVGIGSGDSIMIAGLLQNDEFNDIEGLPWLKDLPILGPLFSSRGFQQNQTELVVTVTAYIARPIGAGTELSLPTDGFVSASDFDFYLLGRLYKRYAKRALPGTIPMVRGPVGYMME